MKITVVDKLYRASKKLCKEINTKFKHRIKKPPGTHLSRWEDVLKVDFK
jgi:hypothetical protein